MSLSTGSYAEPYGYNTNLENLVVVFEEPYAVFLFAQNQLLYPKAVLLQW
ncbi:unnamed protein product [Eretmochelys imbricata]